MLHTSCSEQSNEKSSIWVQSLVVGCKAQWSGAKFSHGIWGLGGFAIDGNGCGCGLQMHGFSTHLDPYEFILDGFLDFEYFATVFEGLTLLDVSSLCPCFIIMSMFSIASC